MSAIFFRFRPIRRITSALVRAVGYAEVLFAIPREVLSRYRTWRQRGWPWGRFGWSKSSAGSWIIPSFSITRRDRAFAGTVNETTASSASTSKAYRITSRAPSVASPLPQWIDDNRHPTSTQGVKRVWNEGMATNEADQGPVSTQFRCE
jgi:hypothetical protein